MFGSLSTCIFNYIILVSSSIAECFSLRTYKISQQKSREIIILHYRFNHNNIVSPNYRLLVAYLEWFYFSLQVLNFRTILLRQPEHTTLQYFHYQYVYNKNLSNITSLIFQFKPHQSDWNFAIVSCQGLHGNDIALEENEL